MSAAVVADPALSFAYNAPVGKAVLETAVAIVAGLVSFLVAGRYRRLRQPGDLVLAVALAVAALDYPLLVALPRLIGADTGGGEDATFWAYLVAHAGVAGLFCWAAIEPLFQPEYCRAVVPEQTANPLTSALPSAPARRRRRRSSDARMAFCFVAAVAVVCLLMLLYFGLDPDARQTPVAASVHLFGQPGTSAVRLLSSAFFFVAAMGFARRARSGHDLIRWLSAGCSLLGVGDLQYGLYPPVLHNVLHFGDIFRLAAVLVFAAGAAVEIHSYWNEIRRLTRVEERRAVAIDLHDGVAQELAFLAAHVRTSPVGVQGGEWIEQLRSATDRALAESRRAIAALVADRPLALSADIEASIREVTGSAGVEVELELPPSRIDELHRETLLRIVREAVINAVRHAAPGVVHIRLRDDPHPVLSIWDDGSGFDLSSVDPSRHFGITSMRERARRLGGDLTIWSQPGSGTSVEIAWRPGAPSVDDLRKPRGGTGRGAWRFRPRPPRTLASSTNAVARW